MIARSLLRIVQAIEEASRDKMISRRALIKKSLQHPEGKNQSNT
ncbi:MAG: hypothetical protein OEW89_12075 [Gammaproteobacteria bacterium]|jgi:hypothetical protein|nr:hypothetical protein [Gammaproteobacteria bacterium]